MKIQLLNLCITCLLASPVTNAQPGTAALTPVQSLGLQVVNVEVPQQYKTIMPGTYSVNLPVGYKARIFYAGELNKPRLMSFDSEGVLHVSDDNTNGNGKVYALPDTDHDGIADSKINAATGFTNNHDVKFYKGNMYVTESFQVWKCVDSDHDGIYESKTVFIDSIGYGTPVGNHHTRTLVFDSINQKAYVSIGSTCNVCRETERAIIRQYNDDGTGNKIYARGVRNAVGMTIHPKTNRLWANNNGSDNQGNETPPEWIDLVRKDGFYGHPLAYGNQAWFNFNSGSDYQALKPITAMDSSLVEKMIQPAALIRAHSAPMALQFLDGNFASDLQNGFLVALRGSWNTTSPSDFRGYKVIYADLSNEQDTTVNYVADFCTGFLTDSINRVYWGRPVGLAIDRSGTIFISSDEGNKFIMAIYHDVATGTKKLNNDLKWSSHPNPITNELTINLELREASDIVISMMDVTGKEKLRYHSEKILSASLHTIRIDTHLLNAGIYFCSIKTANTTSVKKIICAN